MSKFIRTLKTYPTIGVRAFLVVLISLFFLAFPCPVLADPCGGLAKKFEKRIYAMLDNVGELCSSTEGNDSPLGKVSMIVPILKDVFALIVVYEKAPDKCRAALDKMIELEDDNMSKRVSEIEARCEGVDNPF